MKLLHRRPDFESDLERYWYHIAAHDPDAADRFLDHVAHALGELQRTPEIGRLRRWRDRRLAGVRSWRIPGYRNWLVFYRETPSAIEVLRCLHGMMDLENRITEDL